MNYTGVFVFGDSLVDSGNALKLANFYSDLTFSDLPDGAPSADLGYYKGRFADGYNSECRSIRLRRTRAATTSISLMAARRSGTARKPFPNLTTAAFIVG